MPLIRTGLHTEFSIDTAHHDLLILVISHQHLLICLIEPKGSDKYSPGNLELLLWISMLIGFGLDLTELASPWRGTASSQRVGFLRGGKQGKGRGGEEKRESGLKKGGVLLGGRVDRGDRGGLEERGRYCQLACG